MKVMIYYISILMSIFSIAQSCATSEEDKQNPIITESAELEDENTSSYLLPDIDLNHWKVTLPIGNPTEVKPPEILNYATNPLLQEFMYNDSTDGSLVFYTYPGSTTKNSSYSRTELREQMVPGSNNTNWTFAQGGKMRGTLKLENVSKGSDGDFHDLMVMQIHGRLTNQQKDDIGKDDNDAPPVLKIYWRNGRIRVIRKILKNIETSYPEILKKDAWTDQGKWFEQRVDNDSFTVEIEVKSTQMKVLLNDSEEVVFDDIHTERWGVFENYFKAGNYLLTIDEGAFATVKYYDLEVSH